MEEQQILLELKGISKQYPGVKALDNVSLTLRKGEVLGLVGENGAGKSTMIKIITGVESRDEGEILINGQAVEMKTPSEAKMVHKIAYVSQENTLCPDLTVAENMALGNWKTGMGIIDWKQINKFAQEALDDIGLQVRPTALLSDISPSDRQLVEIARAISMDSHILLLDEPTSWLSEDEKTRLFEKVEHLTSHKGVGIIFISHFLDEVMNICDRIQVMREGKCVGVFPKEEMTKEKLIEKMLGQKLFDSMADEDAFDTATDEVVLKAESLTMHGYVNNVSFELHKGEILGITGLLGCGKSELGRMVFGAAPIDDGTIYIEGVEYNRMTPNASIAAGIGYISKDRKEEGIVPFLSVTKNIILANLKSIVGKFPVMNLQKEKKIALEMIEALDVRPRDPSREIMYLSGGNQQKVIIAKWLQANSKILVLDEPTRGIDIGAKYEIYKLLREQARQGKAVLFISSELTEILSVCDRILTVKDGCITGEYKHGEIPDERRLLAILSA